ncbi:RagB/SusD family nutrient uptake outer membrane protein [uncultured Maribacter sp.]|uniref:RagB/SusD family nutrient uptake outer membrane protein n=1 Tax=uncultured Maribacter sp. TaxID=431308 RepID=UPI0030DD88D1|tara:strand:- start:15737 stop:17287 length:1551 start_codon:yes stop_codon:yes gene_type:complete
MKTYTLKVLLLAISATIFIGCEDELDIINPNRSGVDSYYSNQAEAIAAVDAVYNPLIIDGLYNRMTPVLGDGRGDEAKSRSPWAFLSQTSNFTIPATDDAVGWCYEGYYILISRANQAIERVPEVPEVEENLRARLLGQAHFLRALAYFNATNIFDNVPLVLEVPKSQEDFYPSNQGVTQATIYAQVEADLNVAIASLPVNYDLVSGPDAGQVGRATKGAAQALMGKLKLYQGDYSAAIPFFDAVINSGEYSLHSNYQDLFTQDPTRENANTGRIFWAEFTQSQNADFNWGGDPTVNWRQFSAVAPTYSGADFYDFFPTEFLFNELREERTIDGQLDPRFAATILSFEPEEGLTQSYGTDFFLDPSNYYIAKYTLANEGGDPFTSGINYHILRYADVLLMQAENLANTGNMPGAASLVQQVRDRANLPDREAEFAALNLTQFMDQLAHERITELAIEGLRYYDIKRWGWLNDATKLAELKANDDEFNTFVPGREYQPIVQGELDRNPNLVGNSANQ